MEKFAFVIHPIDAKRDVARKYPIAKFLPERLVEWGLKFKEPMVLSHITGVKSATGKEAEGWFIGCPLTPRQMSTLPLDFVYEKIIKAGRLAEEQGARIIGLGAHTSVVGDGGITIAKNLNIAVTTGNSYTIATGIEGVLRAAEIMDIDPSKAKAAVVGAAGSIGRTCARILARRMPELALVDRSLEPLNKVATEIAAESDCTTKVFTEVHTGIRDADIIITVTSAINAIIHPSDLKSGAVVCDIARPRDVSARVAKERNDVLVIEGGVVAVPGDVDFRFNFGFPPKTAYACMSETMILALEGRYENFTLGKNVSVEQVTEISALAQKHGFKLAGFRSFEKAVTDEHIEFIRANARRQRS
ncbi:MAG: shikimate dehydrogenase [Armatimonadota bacterium]|nr:shikimate dehydrogenase [Armatimonadota bacterium]